jgi:hypothetical protein
MPQLSKIQHELLLMEKLLSQSKGIKFMHLPVTVIFPANYVNRN